MAYVGKRLLQAVPLLLGIATITFLVVHLAPGDPWIFTSRRALLERSNRKRSISSEKNMGSTGPSISNTSNAGY